MGTSRGEKLLFCVFLSLSVIRTQAQEKCFSPLDLVFALDASGSVEEAGFNQVKDFAKTIIDGFRYGLRDTHVGVLTFSEVGEVQIGLTETFDRVELDKKIKGLTYAGYRTNTNDALEVVGKNMFSMAGGARQGVPKVLIFLTDGKCTLCENKGVGASAKALKDQGVTIFAIGVTDAIGDEGKEELKQIASQPSNDHMFLIKDFNSLKLSIGELQQKSCTVKKGKCMKPDDNPICRNNDRDTCNTDGQCTGVQKCCNNGCVMACTFPLLHCQTAIDIAFALDSSSSVRPEAFEKMKTFAGRIAESFTVSQTDARFATLIYSEKADVKFRFQRYDTSIQVVHALGDLPHIRSDTRVDQALDAAKAELFNLDGKVRSRRPMVLIVFFDGDVSRNMRDLEVVAAPLKNYGVKIVAIGVGNEINLFQIRKVASAPNMIYDGDSFDALMPRIFDIAKETCNKKFGECAPDPDPISAEFCVGVANDCENDFDCFGNSKCCHRGCKNTCVRPPTTCSRKMDIAFAMHNLMDEGDFQASKYFIKSVVDQFQIGEDKTHVAMMRFGPESKVEFDFNSDQSSNEKVKDRIQALQHQRGSGSLSSLMALACESIFCKQGGTRGEYHKMMVIITGPLPPPESSLLAEKVKTLRRRGVDILVVGVGGVDAVMLQKVTSDELYKDDRMMLARDFSGIVQYVRDIPDFACGEGATTPKPEDLATGCQPKTCVKGEKGSLGRPGVVGSQGDSGMRGPSGPKGLQGPKGEAGPDGTAGAKGIRGDPGLLGLPGFSGYNGIPGIPGEIGPTGLDGDCGLPGKSGEAGDPGIDGFIGTVGPIGGNGLKGEKGFPSLPNPNIKIFPGDKGEVGEAGQRNRKGHKGEEGFRGFDGDLGPNGEDGPKGASGDMGDYGAFNFRKGPKGSRGQHGKRGIQQVTREEGGVEGLVGPTGQAGEKGQKGDLGLTGEPSIINGRKGQIGEQGFKGYLGFRGAAGGTGKTGVFGEPGIDGENGFRGLEGLSGIPGRRGQKGATGVAGVRGSKGGLGDEVAPKSGDTGKSGKDGLEGFPGREGPAGTRGPKAEKGKLGEMLMGPAGDPGSIGSRGFRGPNGLPGIVGMEGFRGPVGNKGDPGPRGDQGRHAKGIAGKSGMDGPPGRGGGTGPVGNTGNAGKKGDKVVMDCVENICPKGMKGQIGAPGNTGDPGEYGIDGKHGNKGYPGGPCPLCPPGQEGVSGEPGNPGTIGENGDQGIQGERGNIGVKGQKGRIGTAGLAGSDGEKGQIGDIGLIGLGGDPSRGNQRDAPKGFKGGSGSAGDIGLRGSKGRKGKFGIRGPAGPQGSRGQRGFKGLSGETGIKGFNGRPGRQGGPGEEGERGPGFPGSAGNIGRQGQLAATGDKGPVGSKGPQGSEPTPNEIAEVRGNMIDNAGEPGLRGKIGVLGSKAGVGRLGPEGPKGERGPRGAKGYGGIRGIVGPEGRAGDDGDPGRAGFPGTNGQRGVPGDNGKAGPKGVAPKGHKGEQGLPGIDGSPGKDASPTMGCVDFGDPTDIAFILDSSRSVTGEDFDRQKEFIKNFLKRFPIGAQQTQAGIIKYGKTANIEIEFNDFTTEAKLSTAIGRIMHSQANESRLDLAFRLARDQLFTAARGSRGQLANKALVLLGDGFISGGGERAINLQKNALKYADDLKREGVTIFALGVGAERNKYLLQEIVSDQSYYLEIESYSDLLTRIYEVQNDLEDTCTYVGDPGRDGLPGQPGRDGERGEKGKNGMRPPGPAGRRGLKGLVGESLSGRPGTPGLSGLVGLLGQKGSTGRDGRDARGERGIKGEKGNKADNTVGPRGLTGDKGFPGPVGPQSQTLCDNVLATDIVFVVDTSSSVGHDNFHQMKLFIKSIVSSFDVDNQLTRVAIITFDETAVLQIPLARHNALQTLLDNIDRLRYGNGLATRTDKALLLAMRDGFAEKNGARGGVNKALVFMTDGQQSFARDATSIVDAVEPLAKAKVYRYAMGIGREIAPTELNTIAPNNVVYADNFLQLKLKVNDQLGIIAKRGCRGTDGSSGRVGRNGIDGLPGRPGATGPQGERGLPGLEGLKGYKGKSGSSFGAGNKGQKGGYGDFGPQGLPGCKPGQQPGGIGSSRDVVTDLVFMLDASGSLYPDGFRREKEFVKNVIDKMGEISFAGTHVGIIVYSDEANIRIKLKDHYSNTDLKNAIDNIPYDSQGTRIDLGLKEAQKMFNDDTDHGARGNSKKVLILLTDGQRTYVPRVTEPSVVAKELIADGIDIFAVGIGPEIDRVELESFISKPEYLFLAPEIAKIVSAVSEEITTALRCEGGPRGNEGQTGDDGPPGTIGPGGKQGGPGPKGVVGDPGFGPKGESGPAGGVGINGAKGGDGFRGPVGAVGDAGPRGPPGYKGVQGVKGSESLPGFVGNEGPPGVPGAPGGRGETVGSGNIGARGDIGERGLPGPFGDKGTLPLGNVIQDYAGNKGNQGTKGFTGGRGLPGQLLVAPGELGVQGTGGESGDRGEFGPRGVQGTNGPDGRQGVRGDLGPLGDLGTPGRPGKVGPDGGTGGQGYQGRTRKGERGEAGSPGGIGRLGSFGLKGFPGFMGMHGEKGDLGESGFPGISPIPDSVPPRGPPGLKGEVGDSGPKGLRGEPAPPNQSDDDVKGNKGSPGPKGKEGDSGLRGTGSDGLPGLMGMPGETGSKGFRGDAGFRGRTGAQGQVIGGSDPGEIGAFGKQGLRGRPGRPGLIGRKGGLGRPGPKGSIGPPGNNGFPGLSGSQGSPGKQGPDAGPGIEGNRGQPGSPGPPGPSGIAEGFHIVTHSQDPFVPKCPRAYKKLWEGYSMMYTVGNGKSHSQDLGDPGSCARSFSTMPFLFCDIAGTCKYASRNDFVYWLSGDVTQPMMPVSNTAIEPFISRCVVCEAPSVHIAVHSQDARTPDCPPGWGSLWKGYSFMMVAGAGKTGAGQSLSSSGSCLADFRPKPFIECQGARGTCHFFSDKFSFWLTTIDPRRQFEIQQPTTLKSDNLKSRVSRCRVCVRERIRRSDGADGDAGRGFLRRFRKNIDKIFGE